MMCECRHVATLGVIVSACLCLAMLGDRAQAQDTPPSTPPEKQTEDESKKPGGDPPSLDELLGLEEDESSAEAAERERDDELQRRLNEEEISEAFEQAIEKMNLSAELLDEKFETGVGTQRVQEEIIAKLDVLIEQAKQMQQQSSSSSSSSSSQSQSQDPGRQQQQQQNQGDQRNQSPSDSQEGDPPPRQDGDINTVLEETRQEWGNLPDRVRDLLLQGRRETFSSVYRQLTEEYYKRLAEGG